MLNVVATPRLSKLDDIVLDTLSPAVVHDTAVDIELVEIELITAEELAEQAATRPFSKLSDPYELLEIDLGEPAIDSTYVPSARFDLDLEPWRTDSLSWLVISLVAGVTAVVAMCFAA